jgi:hypothetical protein
MRFTESWMKQQQFGMDSWTVAQQPKETSTTEARRHGENQKEKSTAEARRRGEKLKSQSQPWRCASQNHQLINDLWTAGALACERNPGLR